jgi:hypothetical protein
MQQNKIIEKQEFLNYYTPILKGYSESFKNQISSRELLSNDLFKDRGHITTDELTEFINAQDDSSVKSVLNRFLGVREIIHCRDNNLQLDIPVVWNFISKSIRLIPSVHTISSIGSQGFLSIPLYKSDETLENFDFLRLHIWDDSLNDFMDLKKCEDFSIHSHTFFVKSWIITGAVSNDRFEYAKESENAQHSFFKVIYNDSLNEVNQHTSKAVNQNIDVELIQVKKEVHNARDYYEIEPSKLHKSGHLNSPKCSATFFSFTGKDGLGESFVIGPKEIKESEVNRKMNISPFALLDKIDKQI